MTGLTWLGAPAPTGRRWDLLAGLLASGMATW
jgi:hypothetical protein